MMVTGNDEQPQASRERVRRFRQGRKREGCARLEVTIGADVVAMLKAVAMRTRLPVWKCAEAAIEAWSKAKDKESIR